MHHTQKGYRTKIDMELQKAIWDIVIKLAHRTLYDVDGQV